MKNTLVRTLSVIVLAMFSMTAWAHTGHESSGSFAAGFGHPVGGLDHLLAMIAVGIWASQIRSQGKWTVPMAFVVIMMAGGLAGMAGIAMPFVEHGILLSVIAMGLLIAAACVLPLGAALPLVGVFALFHGHAHGTEMPEASGALLYLVGFALATALLHLAGMGLGTLFRDGRWAFISRFTGAAIAFGGVYLALS